MYTEEEFQKLYALYEERKKDIDSKPSPLQNAAQDANLTHYQFQLNSYNSFNRGWLAAMDSIKVKGEGYDYQRL